MRRLFLCFLAAVLSLTCACPAVMAETVSWMSFRVDRAAETLDLGAFRITDYPSFNDFIAQLPGLKRVNMYGSCPGSEEIAMLQERFPDVEFGFSIVLGKRRIRTDATAFSTQYREGDRTVDYDGASMLRYCRSLYALDIGHNPVGRLDFLYEMPELRVLIVAFCDLTDITPVASLKHLEYLEIFQNEITDVSCLSGLEYLMDLNLVRNRIGDLTPLSGIRGLKRLWIRQSDYETPGAPDAGTVAMLREALPDCRIDEVSASVSGGWRQGSHYHTIRRMFILNRYEPFADSDPENMPEPWRTEYLQHASQNR